MDKVDRQRRNLILFSLGILIYVIGCGSVHENFSILGGGFRLERAWVVEWAALIGFVYTWWRYWLHVRWPFAGARKDFYEAVRTSKPYTALVLKKTKGGHAGNPLISREGSRYQLDFTKAMLGTSAPSEIVRQHGKKDVKTFTIWRSWISAALSMLFTRKWFSDSAVPYILAVLAGIALLARWSGYSGIACC